MGNQNLFGIALFDWDGFNYSFNRARLFMGEKERDAEYNVLCNSPYYKRGDGDLRKFESEIEVTSLYAKNGSNEVGFGNKESTWVQGDVLKPIPLTSEIFEKNGFVKEIVTNDDTNDDCTAYHWNPTPQYPSDGLWFYPTFSGYAFEYIMMSKIKIKYVHELQHLLRLCGIDKEITLT